MPSRRAGDNTGCHPCGASPPTPLTPIGDDDVPTLEEQLDDLRSHGIALRGGRTVEELLASASRDDFERDPYLTLLMVLGGEV